MQSLGRVSETHFYLMRKDPLRKERLVYRRLWNGVDFQVGVFPSREELAKRICKQDQNSKLADKMRWRPCVPITHAERY